MVTSRLWFTLLLYLTFMKTKTRSECQVDNIVFQYTFLVIMTAQVLVCHCCCSGIKTCSANLCTVCVD